MEQGVSHQDRETIQKYFERPLESITFDYFKKKLKALRAKYHPDQFEKFEDETIQELATERFQTIERLAAKIEQLLSGRTHQWQGDTASQTQAEFMSKDAVFRSKKMKIEIKTSDKDLKYDMFERFYRWLQYGEIFPIPNTSATIIMDEDQYGRRIGYQETIRIYLTFGEEQAVEDVVDWLHGKIAGRADSLIIGQELVQNDYEQILRSIKKQTFLRLEAPSSSQH